MSKRTVILQLPMTEAQAKAVMSVAKRYGLTRSNLADRLCYSLYGKKKK